MENDVQPSPYHLNLRKVICFIYIPTFYAPINASLNSLAFNSCIFNAKKLAQIFNLSENYDDNNNKGG